MTSFLAQELNSLHNFDHASQSEDLKTFKDLL